MVRLRIAFLLSITAITAGLNAESAFAEEPVTLAGRWSAGPLTTKWVIGQWGEACGPEPGGGAAPATSVLIEQNGNELTITGGGRTYTTNQCWELYPGLRVISHSASKRSWRTACRTAPSDPRQATITTTLTATDTSISFYEAGQYQFLIKGQNCTASVGRYRTFSLVQRAGAPDEIPVASAEPAEPEKPAKEPPRNPCAEVGPPARLEVRPARKLLRPGESFDFRAIVMDAKGCPARRAPAWAIATAGAKAEVTPAGKVSVGEDAPEGDIEVTASVGGKTALVTVEVASKERYEALLKSGNFDETGAVPAAASVAIASNTIGAKSAVAEDRASDRKAMFVGIVGTVALLLGLVGFVMVRRTRRAAARAESQSAVVASAPEPMPAPAPPEPPVAAPPTPKRICPVCGKHYPAESRFCGQDGASLVPIN